VHWSVLNAVDGERPGRLPDVERAFEPLTYLQDYREHRDFLLSRESYRGATILLANVIVGAESFTGTEGGLPALGIRVVIAPGFGPVFFSAAVRQGILPVALPQDIIDRMVTCVEAGPREEITVDLDAQIVDIRLMGPISFETPPRVRHKLLRGLDDLDELMQHRENASAFRMEDRNRRPWLYGAGAPVEPSDRGSDEPD
jgi:3-isopropylmalate/(R)-2-methylmalate dehydratase small subunit